MIGGAQSKPKGTFSRYTGLLPVKVVAVNPTQKELQEMTGNDNLPEFLTNYDKIDIQGITCRPIIFWVRNEKYNILEQVKFLISTTPRAKSQKGNTQFINGVGNITWAPSLDDLLNNPKMKWFTDAGGIRPVLHGEADLYDFLQKLVLYDANSKDAQWIVDLENKGMSPSRLFQADYEGLRALIKFANDNGNHIGVLFEVREVTKDGESKQYQSINSREGNFFKLTLGNEISDYHRDLLKKKSSERPVTKNYYTVDFMEFDKSKCYNYDGPVEAPSQVAEPSASADVTTGGDLPF